MSESEEKVLKFPKSHDNERWEDAAENTLNNASNHASGMSRVIVVSYTIEGSLKIFFSSSNIADNVLMLERAKHYMAHEL